MAAIVKIRLLSADPDVDTVFGCLPRHRTCIRGAATTTGASMAWLLALTTPGTPRCTSTVALIG